MFRALLVAVAAFALAADEPNHGFDKEELEKLLRADRTCMSAAPRSLFNNTLTPCATVALARPLADSQKISNVFDPVNKIQYTWHIETQMLCPGVDGVCSKEEL